MWFRSRFPEDLYPAINVGNYNHNVELGYHKAKSKTIAIVGLAHNCAGVIEQNIDRCITLIDFFGDGNIHIVENGSTDSTSELMCDYGVSISRKKPKFEPLDQLRFHYMAHLRNEYMNWLKKVCPDYVLVYDFDIEGGFSYDGIMHSISQKKNCVGSNGLVYTPDRKFYDYISLIYSDKRKGNGDVRYDRGENLVPVTSVFGGACLYEYAPMSELRYDGASEGCEHTSINKKLDCYLNPSQIVLYGKNFYTI